MYFRKDETEKLPTWICTNSSGAFVAAIIKGPSVKRTHAEIDARAARATTGRWSVNTGDGHTKEKRVADDLSLEDAFEFILNL